MKLMYNVKELDNKIGEEKLIKSFDSKEEAYEFAHLCCLELKHSGKDIVIVASISNDNK